MNNLIAESIKRFGEKFTHDPRCPAIEDDNEDCFCVFGKAEDFFKQELTSIKEKTREDTLNEFSEYCHKFYNGTTLQNGEWEYSYKKEVITMVEGFLSDKESK